MNERKERLRILIVRFRQMGDTVVATSMLDTIRKSFPHAQTDLVLNERIAPLFEGHPSIHRIITFSDDERHQPLTYLRKIWQTMKTCHYDVIIDMRSTVNTLPFTLFSLRTPLRIGLIKGYTRWVFNHRVPRCGNDESMVHHNLRFLQPLTRYGQLHVCTDPSLNIREEEKHTFRRYMQAQGINFDLPVMLVGVTTRLSYKTWPEERMIDILSRLSATFPEWQLIFNFAPGQEADNAHRIYEKLGRPNHVFVNIEARNTRQLAAMASLCQGYFGNEGGARHIAQAMGCPSLVICSPSARKVKWIPDDAKVLSWGIEYADTPETDGMTDIEKYQTISVEEVWQRLEQFIQAIRS